MHWLVLTEYTARFVGDGQQALIDIATPLVEQRLLIDDAITQSRAFTARTNLVHVQADAPCLVEINNPSASTELDKDGEEYFAVLAGSQLTVIKDALAQENFNG